MSKTVLSLLMRYALGPLLSRPGAAGGKKVPRVLRNVILAKSYFKSEG
jgi:hypothetical protein